VGAATYTVKALDESTWASFAALVERNNGVFGGCWCMGFHPDDAGKGAPPALNRERKLARVRAGRAHAALVFDGDDIAAALAKADAPVIAVARTGTALAELAGETDGIQPEVADAGDPSVAAGLLERHQPAAVILVAGATPPMRPLQEHSWETFSVNWDSDVRIAFNWLREVLVKPVAPGSEVIVISSGAAERIAAQRRVRRRQGHPTLYRRLRAGGSQPGSPTYHGHGLVPAGDTAHRPRTCRNPGLRGP
jgi:hypothetical protein